MSSIHRQSGKPNWFCFFRDSSGKICHRSTQTSNRRDAKRICDAMQLAADLAKGGQLTAGRARKLIEDTALNITEAGKPLDTITVGDFFRTWLKEVEAKGGRLAFTVPPKGRATYARVCTLFEQVIGQLLSASGHALPRFTIAEYFQSWIKQILPEMTAGTSTRYQGIVDNFLLWMGSEKYRSLTALTSDEVQKYRDFMAGKVARGTVNTHLKVLRVALNQALQRRFITENPAKFVGTLDNSDKLSRRPFTLEELKRLFDLADAEWKGMILFGLYGGGLRIGDVANLCETNLDLERAEFWTATRKTKRTQVLPLAKPLRAWLQERDNIIRLPKAPLFPTLHGKKSSWLSNQFYELMTTAVLVLKRDHQSRNKGRDQRRRLQDISFHSLRHTATSLLKNAGVSDVVARDIVGHESAAISRNYTHIDAETKRQALEKMPNIFQL